MLLSYHIQDLQESAYYLGLSTGHFWTQPETDPLTSDGGRRDPPLTASNHGYSWIGLG